jgi:hypothetical protein
MGYPWGINEDGALVRGESTREEAGEITREYFKGDKDIVNIVRHAINSQLGVI